MRAPHRLALLATTFTLGGCYSTTVLRPADWPEGIEVLAAPPPGPPLAMIETLAEYHSPESCREELARKAKELGATAIYVASESRSVSYALAILRGDRRHVSGICLRGRLARGRASSHARPNPCAATARDEAPSVNRPFQLESPKSRIYAGVVSRNRAFLRKRIGF